MKTCVVSLLVFAAIQVVFSTYVKDDFEAIGGINYDIKPEDIKYNTMNEPDSVGLRKCSATMCCLKSQKCVINFQCKSLIGSWDTPQVRCPTTVKLM